MSSEENKAFPPTNETLYKLNGTLMNIHKELKRLADAAEKQR